MKKVLTLTIGFLASTCLMAQVPKVDDPAKLESLKAPQQSNSLGSPQNAQTLNKKGKQFEHYFNYWSALDSVNRASLNPQASGFINIHWDSLRLIDQDGNSGDVFLHSAGMVIDPYSEIFTAVNGSENKFNRDSTRWTLDSVIFPYRYNRPVDSYPVPDVVSKMDTAYDFAVNGDFLDSIKFKKDTTWKYTSKTDSTALSAYQIKIYDDNLPPNVKDTIYGFPPYNVYDTSASVDTQDLMPDSTLMNSENPYTYKDTVGTTKKQAVDTLKINIYREQLGDENPTSMITGFWPPTFPDTVFFASPPFNNDRRQGNDFVTSREKTILLTQEDTAESITRLISEEVGLSSNNTTGEKTIMAATITYRPGYPYQITDTISDASKDNNIYQNNSFRLIRLADESGYFMKSYNNGLRLITGQVYNPDQYTDDEGNTTIPGISYLPANGPVAQDGSTSTMLFYDMDFHITANNVGEVDDGGDGDGDGDGDTGGISENSNVNLNTIYPNPAKINSEINVNLTLEKASKVNLVLYNSIGKVVKNFGSENLNQGAQSLNLNTEGIEPGIYFLKTRTDNGEETTKVTITK